MNYSKDELYQFIDRAILEDVGEGDHTSLSTIPAGTQSRARLLVKEDGVLAGQAIALEIFNRIDSSLKVETFKRDGEPIMVSDIVLTVEGSVHSILKAERLVLNTMQRMSGIATTTNKIVQKVAATKCKILDTRKTTPGLRFLEKEAVKIGGGHNHRIGLYDMILIKDNHVDYAGGVKQALQNAKAYVQKLGKPLKIEIETRNLDELREAMAEGGFFRVMLDNYSFDDIKTAVKLVDGKYEVEASGGIVPENVYDYAVCGVDCISMGALTHSVKSLDLSLKAY
jgi:nicotinate-nucleotide pyrophosphorylase (carboxylating)